MANSLLFHVTQPTSRSTTTQETIALSKPIISEHQSK